MVRTGRVSPAAKHGDGSRPDRPSPPGPPYLSGMCSTDRRGSARPGAAKVRTIALGPDFRTPPTSFAVLTPA
jgi:hypothetical protein